MILRGAPLSEKRLTLDTGRPDRLKPLSKSGGVPARPVTVAVPDNLPTGLDRPAISLAPPPTPLSVEIVSAWLANQDEATRAKLAAQLTEDLTALRNDAQLSGYEAGHAKGLQESSSRTQSVLATLRAMTSSAEEAFSRESSQLAGQCAQIVSEALAKIAGPLLATHEVALGTVVQVLQRIKDERDIVVRVNAQDLTPLQLAESEIAASLGGRRFSLIADPQVATGGCIVESQLGTIDARLEVQLRALLEAIHAVRSNARPDEPRSAFSSQQRREEVAP